MFIIQLRISIEIGESFSYSILKKKYSPIIEILLHKNFCLHIISQSQKVLSIENHQEEYFQVKDFQIFYNLNVIIPWLILYIILRSNQNL